MNNKQNQKELTIKMKTNKHAFCKSLDSTDIDMDEYDKYIQEQKYVVDVFNKYDALTNRMKYGIDEVWKRVNLKMETDGKVIKTDYEISSYGNLRRLSTGNIVVCGIVNGYRNAHIHYNTNSKRCKKVIAVNRLVLSIFLRHPTKDDVCNHIDGNKLNNHVSNLEWTTQKANMHHARDTGLTKRHPKAVNKLDENGNIIATYNSIDLAAASIKLGRHSVSKVLSGENDTAGGFKWEYVEKKKHDKALVIAPTEFTVIKDYPIYVITKKGEVYNTYTKRYLKPWLNNGYCHVTFCNDIGKKRNYKVHRLVADAYIPNTNREERDIVNHKDGNKTNNNVENLEWVNNSENRKHAINMKKQADEGDI